MLKVHFLRCVMFVGMAVVVPSIAADASPPLIPTLLDKSSVNTAQVEPKSSPSSTRSENYPLRNLTGFEVVALNQVDERKPLFRIDNDLKAQFSTDAIVSVPTAKEKSEPGVWSAVFSTLALVLFFFVRRIS